jgi:hypothetical protein
MKTVSGKSTTLAAALAKLLKAPPVRVGGVVFTPLTELQRMMTLHDLTGGRVRFAAPEHQQLVSAGICPLMSAEGEPDGSVCAIAEPLTRDAILHFLTAPAVRLSPFGPFITAISGAGITASGRGSLLDSAVAKAIDRLNGRLSDHPLFAAAAADCKLPSWLTAVDLPAGQGIADDCIDGADTLLDFIGSAGRAHTLIPSTQAGPDAARVLTKGVVLLAANALYTGGVTRAKHEKNVKTTTVATFYTGEHGAAPKETKEGGGKAARHREAQELSKQVKHVLRVLVEYPSSPVVDTTGRYFESGPDFVVVVDRSNAHLLFDSAFATALGSVMGLSPESSGEGDAGGGGS